MTDPIVEKVLQLARTLDSGSGGLNRDHHSSFKLGRGALKGEKLKVYLGSRGITDNVYFSVEVGGVEVTISFGEIYQIELEPREHTRKVKKFLTFNSDGSFECDLPGLLDEVLVGLGVTKEQIALWKLRK